MREITIPIRAFCVVGIVLATALGCVKSRLTVYVNPDGSGNLVVSRLYGREIVESVLSGLASKQKMHVGDAPRHAATGRSPTESAGDGTANGRARRVQLPDPFFCEKALRREARTYGSGVKLVNARRLDIDGSRGFIAVYSFADINDVCIAPDVRRIREAVFHGDANPDASDEGEVGDEAGGRRRENLLVEFSLQTGAVSRLKILLPEGLTQTGNDDSNYDGFHADVTRSPAEKDAVEWLEWDMSWSWSSVSPGSYEICMGVDVVFGGEVVAGNASHTNAAQRNRIVLLDADTTRRERKIFMSNCYSIWNCFDVGRTIRGLGTEHGVVVETNREVVVDFR